MPARHWLVYRARVTVPAAHTASPARGRAGSKLPVALAAATLSMIATPAAAQVGAAVSRLQRLSFSRLFAQRIPTRRDTGPILRCAERALRWSLGQRGCRARRRVAGARSDGERWICEAAQIRTDRRRWFGLRTLFQLLGPWLLKLLRGALCRRPRKDSLVTGFRFARLFRFWLDLAWGGHGPIQPGAPYAAPGIGRRTRPPRWSVPTGDGRRATIGMDLRPLLVSRRNHYPWWWSEILPYPTIGSHGPYFRFELCGFEPPRD